MERWRGGEVERWSHSSNIVPSAVMPHLSLPRLAAVLCRRPSCRTSPFPGRQQCCAVGRHAAPPALSLSLTHTHTLSHSLTHTHTHLLTHLLTHSHTHSPPTHSLLPNCLTHSFTHSLTLSLTHSYGWGSSMCVWMGAVHVCVDGGRACVCGWGACMCVWMGAAVEIQWPAVEIQWPAVEIQWPAGRYNGQLWRYNGQLWRYNGQLWRYQWRARAEHVHVRSHTPLDISSIRCAYSSLIPP